MDLFRTDAERDACLDEFQRVFARIPCRPRDPVQDESGKLDPFDAQGMQEIGSGQFRRQA